MKPLLSAAIAAIALSIAAPASAADLSASAEVHLPAVDAVMYNWSGFYVGANAGVAASRFCWEAAFFGSEGCHDATGGVVGAQIGYRWQSDALVLGLEAQGDWANLEGENVSELFGGNFTNRSRVDALGLFTAQVGYAADNALFYLKGGVAVSRNRFDVLDTPPAPTNSPVADAPDQTRWGTTLGVGVEYGFAPNWSAGVEYNHLFMQSEDSRFTTLPSPGAFFGDESISQGADLITARLNYRFGE